MEHSAWGLSPARFLSLDSRHGGLEGFVRIPLLSRFRGVCLEKTRDLRWFLQKKKRTPVQIAPAS